MLLSSELGVAGSPLLKRVDCDLPTTLPDDPNGADSPTIPLDVAANAVLANVVVVVVPPFRSSRIETDLCEAVAAVAATRSELVDGASNVRFADDENDDERWRTTVVMVSFDVCGERSGDERNGDGECGFVASSVSADSCSSKTTIS